MCVPLPGPDMILICPCSLRISIHPSEFVEWNPKRKLLISLYHVHGARQPVLCILPGSQLPSICKTVLLVKRTLSRQGAVRKQLFYTMWSILWPQRDSRDWVQSHGWWLSQLYIFNKPQWAVSARHGGACLQPESSENRQETATSWGPVKSLQQVHTSQKCLARPSFKQAQV